MKLNDYFPRVELKQKWAFAACVLTMLVTHLYMFTNKLPNHDDVNRLLVGDTDEVKIQHGRWAGVIFDRISGSSGQHSVCDGDHIDFGVCRNSCRTGVIIPGRK